MKTLVTALYLESSFGSETTLDGAGTSLENPYVYDSAARELHSMEEDGLVKIVDEQLTNASPPLINRIAFTRLR